MGYSWVCAASLVRSGIHAILNLDGGWIVAIGVRDMPAKQLRPGWPMPSRQRLKHRIISIADVPNARSIAVMKRLGMTLDHTAELVHEGETFSAVIYAITRERWQSNIEPIAK